MSETSVPYHTTDRQWDCRINVQTPEYLDHIVSNIKLENERGKFKYILISGVEVGTRPYQSDYQIRHVHIAAIFNNRSTKSSILQKWGIIEGNGYYLVPRKRDLPYSGWREHHIKEYSKVSPNELIIFECGQLPADTASKPTMKSENEKKRKVDEILIDLHELIEEGREDEAFTKFPRTFLQYGEKIKARLKQKKQFVGDTRNPHIWLHGYPGTGKTSIMALLYPNYYKKNLDNKFFDLYDPTIHTHVLLEDLDPDAIEKRISIQFLKTICDEQGFAVDQKYKTPQLARTTVLVTSNYSIDAVIPHDMTQGVSETKAALRRRFWELRVDALLKVLGIKLIDKQERKKLKSDGNEDVRKLFMTWDYLNDMPACEPLKTAEEYQAILREAFYK